MNSRKQKSQMTLKSHQIMLLLWLLLIISTSQRMKSLPGAMSILSIIRSLKERLILLLSLGLRDNLERMLCLLRNLNRLPQRWVMINLNKAQVQLIEAFQIIILRITHQIRKIIIISEAPLQTLLNTTIKKEIRLEILKVSPLDQLILQQVLHR